MQVGVVAPPTIRVRPEPIFRNGEGCLTSGLHAPGSTRPSTGSGRTEEGSAFSRAAEGGAASPAEHASTVLIRPYRAADLEALILQPAQAHLQPLLLGRGYAQTLEACEAWTFAVRESPIEGQAESETAPEKIIACMGVHPIHPARALAWSLIAGDAGRHFHAIHRAARRYLHVTPYARIEAHVEAGFAAGARWLTLLGFECETPQGMRAFTPEGRTCSLYAYINPLAAASADPAAPAPASTHLPRARTSQAA
ncbi:MAG: hypothetical protein JWN73_8 [Betaproteobacteria bacterium]|nr:hypothetical protein [Betaproteobacteria bacterium]